ncbi:twin-arginine translocation signal domain-containing protein [Luteibacter sahnii]|uniref:twin-arginine translocation signal domain-containing protein n=1 Tax=Luteibacter sahnii TaxID=3021977 RepID=UPI002A6B2E8F|nr:twin-arginine translocation signal domain-containing protein [Luteibacter sp. PPL193]MDY1547635.1 twin-arginine translocation signal domain-containing protein [Luteibacter sp. PPL193]
MSDTAPGRRRFLQGMAATGAAMAIGPVTATAAPIASPAVSPPPPVRTPMAALDLQGHVDLPGFRVADTPWRVSEDLTHPDGDLVLNDGARACVIGKRTEASYDESPQPYLGMTLAEIALADADRLADRLLARGEPDEREVRLAAPPVASKLDPENYYGRLPWTSFVGTPPCADTMPVYTSGSTRTYHPDQVFAALHDPAKVARRREGLLGGWLPAVHKVVPLDEGRWYDVIVFADVDATDRFVVQTWHRTALVEHGRFTHVAYGHSYPAYPPRRQPPDAAAFYAALLRFHDLWQGELHGMAAVHGGTPGWADMPRFAFARERVVRPDGTYPRYGAVDRDYAGNEYDGFQDTFTSSLHANLEWGRFAQATAVLDGYFTDFVQPDGMINMRGAETGQFGLTLSLLARYLAYTGDAALLRRHRGKIEATVALLGELHDESLRLAPDDPGHGLIHGWNESDACLFPDPMLWWKPYFANSAMAARGLGDLAACWTRIVPGADVSAWQRRATQLRDRVQASVRASVRHDLSPPYVPPLPGVTRTFREALKQEKPSEQQWPHRAYAELLQADVLPADLANLIVDAMRGHGATTLGVVANIGPVDPGSRDMLGFISHGYAQQLLRLGRIDEYILFLYAHRYHDHTPGSWTAGEVSDITGGMPLFCMPAQMTVPLVLRWAFVFDEGDTLWLGRAIPRAWLADRAPVGMTGAPTPWGMCSMSLRREGDVLHGEVQLPDRAVPGQVRLCLRTPPGKRVDTARRDGEPVRVTDGYVTLTGAPGQRVKVEALLV